MLSIRVSKFDIALPFELLVLLEAGGVMIGDEVAISIDVEAIKKK